MNYKPFQKQRAIKNFIAHMNRLLEKDCNLFFKHLENGRIVISLAAPEQDLNLGGIFVLAVTSFDSYQFSGHASLRVDTMVTSDLGRGLDSMRTINILLYPRKKNNGHPTETCP